MSESSAAQWRPPTVGDLKRAEQQARVVGALNTVGVSPNLSAADARRVLAENGVHTRATDTELDDFQELRRQKLAERRYGTVTAHVAYAYSRRQNVNAQGKYHLVLNRGVFLCGRYQRQAGETLCAKRTGFWGLDERPEMTTATCPGCVTAAARYGITIQPSTAKSDSED